MQMPDDVTIETVNDAALPLVVRRQGTAPLERWALEHCAWIDTALREHGALLFRQFKIDAVERFQAAAAVLCGTLVEYVHRSTPRTSVARNMYTATEYRADAEIAMHNENAFQPSWPMRLAFCCVQPAASGGQTPLARTAAVTSRLDAALVRRFASRRVMYVRNYGHGIDLPWETTFQTSSRSEVEEYCRREGIACEWLPGGRLRTRHVCQGVAVHPKTHEELWFNQAHLFHVSNLGRDQQTTMLELFEEADLPRHAYFGDGGKIDEADLDRVREAYRAERVLFDWQQGDVLLVDNMLVAHGRMPFTGERKVLVAMGTQTAGISLPAASAAPA
jgi:alpha-ketoglutarate-dependent taurine dioxygenase